MRAIKQELQELQQEVKAIEQELQEQTCLLT